MKIHIINLKEAVKRKESILAQMKTLGKDFEIFDAIKGSALSDKELSEKVDMDEVAKYPNWLTRNMLGASLSHMGVYKRIITSGINWHLVLEDDVLLNKDIVKLMEHIVAHESIYRDHLILFYAVSLTGGIELAKSPITNISNYKIHKVVSKEIGGAGAYMIHRQTAEKFVEMNKFIKVAPDTWHFFLAHRVFSQIDCVCPFAGRPGLFGSTIGYVDPRSIRYKIKHFIEQYRIPGLYHLLRRNRKKIWESTSNIIFK